MSRSESGLPRRVVLALAAIGALMAAGCVSVPLGSTVGRLPALTTGQELVIYRVQDNASLYFEGVLDGQTIGEYVKGGGVNVLKLEPGAHRFTIRIPPMFPSSTMAANTLDISVEARKRKFVRVRPMGGSETRWGTSGAVIGRYVYMIEEVPPSVAELEIHDLKFVR